MEPIPSTTFASTQYTTHIADNPSALVTSPSDGKVKEIAPKFIQKIISKIIDDSIQIDEAIDTGLWRTYLKMFPNVESDRCPYSIFELTKKILTATQKAQDDKQLQAFAAKFGIDLKKLDEKKVLPSLLMLMYSFDETLPEDNRETEALQDPVLFLRCIKDMNKIDEKYKINEIYQYKISRVERDGMLPIALPQTLMLYEMWVIAQGGYEVGELIEEQREQLFDFFREYEVPRGLAPLSDFQRSALSARIERPTQLLDFFQDHGLYVKGDPRRTFENIAVALRIILKEIDLPHAQALSNLKRDPFNDFTYQCMIRFPFGMLAFIAIYYVFERELVKKNFIPEFKKQLWASILSPSSSRNVSSVTSQLSELDLSLPSDEPPVVNVEMAMALLRKDDAFQPFCEKNKIAIDPNCLKMFQNIMSFAAPLAKEHPYICTVSQVITGSWEELGAGIRVF